MSELADGSLKVNVTAPPERGKANEQICELLAERFGVPLRAVEIVRGHTAARKLVRIDR